eukprot:CAMPEP_0114156842 /NCGR_PEP_ID=MMETSP0043_2-20121206/26279_1 /TAXON_ID=464988 /ORGANISM="Hemiselmis andersenii, Strain CCMP644" /LENGTH=30 /DNA_ID= /DNA_START= /DNA_END= /DNA_ORIENTATION=
MPRGGGDWLAHPDRVQVARGRNHTPRNGAA